MLYPFPLYQSCCLAKFFIWEILKIFRQEKPCPLSGGRGGNSVREERKFIFSNETEFVFEITSDQTKSVQIFSIILPNLIHKSRRKNLKR